MLCPKQNELISVIIHISYLHTHTAVHALALAAFSMNLLTSQIHSFLSDLCRQSHLVLLQTPRPLPSPSAGVVPCLRGERLCLHWFKIAITIPRAGVWGHGERGARASIPAFGAPVTCAGVSRVFVTPSPPVDHAAPPAPRFISLALSLL